MTDDKAIVVKDNALVERARYRLSVNEQRVVLTLISKITPEDADFKGYDFKISDLYKLLGFKKESRAVKMRGLIKVLKSLQSKIIEIVTTEREGYGGREIFMFSSWIVAPIIDEEMDSITLKVSDVLKPYLLQLKNKFTRYPLSEVARFKCAYSFRFLEFCKNHEPRADYYDEIINGRYVNTRVYDLAELRLMLGVAQDIYPKLANFKRKVLQTSQREVNSNSSSYFEFEMVKDPADRRKTKAVKLRIFGSEVKSLNDNSGEVLRNRIIQLGCTRKLAELAVGSDRLREKLPGVLEAIEEYARNKKLRWPDAVLKRALENGWLSKVEAARQEEWQKDAEKLLAIEAEENIKKGLASLESEKKHELDTANERAMLGFQEQLDAWEQEYAAVSDKTAYILSLHADVVNLEPSQLSEVQDKIAVQVSSGIGFRDIYDVAGRLIIGFLLPF